MSGFVSLESVAVRLGVSAGKVAGHIGPFLHKNPWAHEKREVPHEIFPEVKVERTFLHPQVLRLKVLKMIR